jgi:hypothetical protein
MPHSIEYKTVSKPVKMLKKDGTLTAQGIKWFELLKEKDLSKDYSNDIKVITKKSTGNPASHQQLKDYLFSLGWRPATFKFVPDKNGNNKKIPQILNGDKLCDSVKLLYTINCYYSCIDIIYYSSLLTLSLHSMIYIV